MSPTPDTAPRPARISVVMGSSSDWETMEHAVLVLRDFGVLHDVQVLSAHRMPDAMFRFAEQAAGQGYRAIIAGAGGAAHLPGMLASKTAVPVLGVPVATFAIGPSGAANAALFAVAMLAAEDPALRAKLSAWRADQTAAASAMTGSLPL